MPAKHDLTFYLQNESKTELWNYKVNSIAGTEDSKAHENYVLQKESYHFRLTEIKTNLTKSIK